MIDNGLQKPKMLLFLNFGLLKFLGDFTKALVEFIKTGAFKLIGVGLGKVGMLDGEQKAVQIPVCLGDIPDEGKNLIDADQPEKNACSNKFGSK